MYVLCVCVCVDFMLKRTDMSSVETHCNLYTHWPAHHERMSQTYNNNDKTNTIVSGLKTFFFYPKDARTFTGIPLSVNLHINVLTFVDFIVSKK